jgi:hypothetical protein
MYICCTSRYGHLWEFSDERYCDSTEFYRFFPLAAVGGKRLVRPPDGCERQQRESEKEGEGEGEGEGGRETMVGIYLKLKR